MPYKNLADRAAKQRTSRAALRAGMPDLRIRRDSGMVVGGTRVDYFTPQPVCGMCAHFDRIHRAPPPHVYHGARHLWIRASSDEREPVTVVA